jgi:hypothetical protein
VRVELLVVPDCPNEAVAREVLGEAAQLAGIADLQTTVTVVDTDEQAQRRGFVGSPTFLMNGVDPFAVAGAPTGVTCRVYTTSHGPAGVPDVAALRDALVRACASRSSAAVDR